MKRFRCPKCGEMVSIEDLIAEEDNGSGDTALLSSSPPKHLSVATEIEGISPVTTIQFKRVNPMALFLIPFTCVWAGGSLAGIYGSQLMRHAFDLRLSLFGIPFLIGSAVLFAACLFMLFGKRVVTLSQGHGRYFAGIGPIGHTRGFEYSRRTKVEECERVGYGRNGRMVSRCLRLSADGDADGVYICSGFSEDALAYAAAAIRRECRR